MNFQSLDLFSTQFQFNVGLKQMGKRSNIGSLLSIVVVVVFLMYFVYLLLLYIGNQIDPKYKMQAFISDDSNKVDLHNDLLAFRYEYQNNTPLEELEKQTGKKYLVYKAVFFTTKQNDIQLYNLDVIQCQNEILQGYNCLDFSNVSNFTLHIDGKQNILNNLFIAVYRCQDTDIYKQTIPDNCASPEEIDNMINDPITAFRLKLFTSQYNTTSEQIQSSYKNVYLNIQGDDFLFTRMKTIKQTTTVKKGPFIQQQTSFSSPIDYIKEERSFNRKGFIEKSGLTLNLQVTLDIDEQVQIIQIQYSTFMEIIAICNSTLAVLMGIGVVGRYFANQLIRQDIKFLLFQNLYQSQYLNVLQKCNIFKSQLQLKEVIKEKSSEDVIENTEQIIIPSFYAKSRENVDNASVNLNKVPLNFFITNSKQQSDKQQNHQDSEENMKYENGLNTYTIQESQHDQLSLNTSLNFQLKLKDKQSKYKDITHQFNHKIRIMETENESITSNLTDQSESIHSKNNIKKNQFQYKKQNQNLSSFLQVRQTNNQKAQNNNNKEEITYPIQTNKCIENLRALYDKQYENKFQNLLFKLKQIIYFNQFQIQLKYLFFISFFKRYSSQLRKCIDPFFNKAIEEQVNKNLDILQLYKDIIIVKKAIMVLLSKEQFAAIQLIGFSNDFYSQLKMNQTDRTKNGQQQYQKSNKEFGYLDEQQMISQSLESQFEYVDKFLKRIQNKEAVSSVDERIYSSITIQ